MRADSSLPEVGVNHPASSLKSMLTENRKVESPSNVMGHFRPDHSPQVRRLGQVGQADWWPLSGGHNGVAAPLRCQDDGAPLAILSYQQVHYALKCHRPVPVGGVESSLVGNEYPETYQGKQEAYLCRVHLGVGRRSRKGYSLVGCGLETAMKTRHRLIPHPNCHDATAVL